jgi:hypothetical protein
MFDNTGVDYDYVYLFVKIAIITALCLGIAVLIPLCILKKDTALITNKPLLFTIETILIGVLPAASLLFFTVSRGLPFEETKLIAIQFGIKFVIFHILFQISGFYKYLIGGY